eukprot:TRINITY_DN985_c0_g1_i1.p1 TRINITY_DN985_c0_g1~~TRINITY_DN985_c0_g1_i1.p1  ORF type:complete len:252 (-),score=30.44 TRINITY_DN985_c0_g1_i1:478-1233(-)
MEYGKGSKKFIPCLKLLCAAVVCQNFEKVNKKIKKVLSNEYQQILFTLIKQLRVQPSLGRLSNPQLVPSVASLVPHFITKSTKDISFPGFSLSEEDCRMLVKYAKSIRSVDFTGCSIATPSCYQILFGGGIKPRKLDLSRMKISDSQMQILSTVVTIKCIHLRYSVVSQQGLVNLFQGRIEIESLDLLGCELSENSMKNLAQRQKAFLRSLMLASNDVDVLNCIKTLSELRKLHLRSRQLTDRVLSTITSN